MAKVRIIPPDEASGPLAEIYARIGGNVANILRIQSLSPQTLESHFDLYRTIMFGKGGLSRAQRELIAVAVSQQNACHY